jgi:hypothetical protein
MQTSNFQKTFKKSMTAAAVAAVLSLSTVAQADNSTGSIYGHANSGTTVTIVSVDNGRSSTVTVEGGGRFSFKQLPPGKYKVTNGGKTIVLTVQLGSGSAAEFGDSTEVISVSGSRMAAIDTSSTESTSVFEADQIELLPVARDITSIAMLAPGTVEGDDGFSSGSASSQNLASFGGSSVAENGYYINGFDVTNLRTLINYAALPFDGIGSVQVKTGGYGAEYGRSLGGVINVVTKKGTNEWKFGVSGYFEPEGLQENRADEVTRDPADDMDHRYFVYNSANNYSELSYNLFAGGPIIEDKLFIFAMYDGRSQETDTYLRQTSTNEKNNSPQYLLKMDWNITDDHIFEATYIKNEVELDTKAYTNVGSYDGKHNFADTTKSAYTETNGGTVTIAKYTGYLTDNLTFSAMYGKLENKLDYRTPETLSGAECSRVFDSRQGGVDYMGCWNQEQTTIRTPGFGPDLDKRTGIRLDLEYTLGDHDLRFGYDDEEWSSSAAGWEYTGGQYYRYFTSNGSVNGVAVPQGTEYVRTWDRGATTGVFAVENDALYIEDHWQVTDDLKLYGGIRRESFTNKNGEGNAFVAADNLNALRLGFSWNVAGDGTKKLYGTAGQYYIPVAANTNIRAAGAEKFDILYHSFSAIDPISAEPILGAQIGDTLVVSSGKAANPATIAATNLQPMHQDEYILGYQQTLDGSWDAWTVGVKGIYRDVKDGMDDYCSHQGFIDWANDNGHTNFDDGGLAGCMMVNPGNDLQISIPLDGNTPDVLTNVSIDAAYLGLPKYKRTYKSLEFTVERANTDGYYLSASYVWSKSRGNMEGYVNSTLEQDDPGLTQDMDHALFTSGTYGDLPNARKHVIKAFGVFDVTEEVSVSANLIIASGRPLSCNGWLPLDPTNPDHVALVDFDKLGVDGGGLAGYGDSTYYCTDGTTGTKFLSNRGDFGSTPWTHRMDVGLSYVPKWAESNLSLRMDVTNIFNLDRPVDLNESSEQGDSSAPDFEPNFLNVNVRQAPRTIRLSARYTF